MNLIEAAKLEILKDENGDLLAGSAHLFNQAEDLTLSVNVHSVVDGRPKRICIAYMLLSRYEKTNRQTNSVVLNPQANYTD
jgi:hypothetical protein